MARLRHLTPLVEQISIDEAFVDVSDLTEGGEAIARQLQAQIAAELHLPCSLGIASNKLVAKIATDVGKTANRGSGPPNAITSVPPGDEAAFLAPQPVEMLWGVGPKTAERLAERGVYTIGQLAAYPELELAYLFGANGHDLARRARGIDNRPIETSHDVKSISSETTFARDVADAAILQQTLRELTESVGRRLRGEHLSGTTVKLKLRWADFTTLTRQERLKQPTDLDDEILHSARRLLAKTWQPPRLVRLIGVGVSGLQPLVRQLSLWDAAGEKERRLHTAVEELRSRFGDGVVQRGSKLDDRR
jgi:DNA polymerase-4